MRAKIGILTHHVGSSLIRPGRAYQKEKVLPGKTVPLTPRAATAIVGHEMDVDAETVDRVVGCVYQCLQGIGRREPDFPFLHPEKQAVWLVEVRDLRLPGGEPKPVVLPRLYVAPDFEEIDKVGSHRSCRFSRFSA
jgi:hypothetical protein